MIEQTTSSDAVSTEAALVDRALSAGPDAFRPIVDRYQSAVFAVAFSRVRDFHLAEDVAQQVFLEAYQKLGSLKDREKLGGWLRTIAVRRALNVIRGNRKEVELQLDGSDGVLVGDANEDREREALKRRVIGAIGSLSKTQRETTTLFYIDGYAIDEVASMLDVPVGTVKRRLHDARARLKSEMMDLVKDTLTSEKPSGDFGDQVYKMIVEFATDRKGQWRQVHDKIAALGMEGVDGLHKAMDSPHGMTRWVVPKVVNAFLRQATTDDQKEGLIDILKTCLDDPNKQVRKAAINALFHLEVPEERKRVEFVPLVIERLDDRSEGVQRKAASKLLAFPEDVPLERAAMALARLNPVGRPSKFPGDMTRRYMNRLVQSIIKSRS